MNRCCCNRKGFRARMRYGPSAYSIVNTGINFQSLIVLILILLQFGKRGDYRNNSGNIVDNSILFIIVFYFLICGCGRGFGRSCGCMEY